jgi:gephyrin
VSRLVAQRLVVHHLFANADCRHPLIPIGAAGQGHHHHHGHGHGHSHGPGGHAGPRPHTKPEERPQSNDPTAGPSSRYRSSPYPMLAVPDALKLISEQTPAPIVEQVPVNMKLGGAVLAEDVKAAESVPAFRASIVDGYAVKIPSSGKFKKGVYPVTIISHAQPGEVKELKDGEIARITTGAPLPPGADAVVMVEDTVLKSQTDDGKEEKEIEILTDAIKAGENVREVGSDVKEGEIILKKGEGITVIGGEFGLLASVGTTKVSVYRRPVVGVLSTGDELIEHNREGPLRLGEVRDTNRPTLITAVRSHRFDAIDLGVASDKYVIYSSCSASITDTGQAWESRGNPPRCSPQVRHGHHVRWRFDGRARSSQAHHRAQSRWHHPLRSREHETRKAHDLCHCARQG